MIVGADNVSSIKSNVEDLGFDEITHLSGRKKSEFRAFRLSNNFDLVLVLTDYIHHTAMKAIKREAKEKDIDIIFSKRSWASIYKKLEKRRVVN
ncbi:DUF2325 domain-containing protein [Natronospora cellulosivora (SeqCode)]